MSSCFLVTVITQNATRITTPAPTTAIITQNVDEDIPAMSPEELDVVGAEVGAEVGGRLSTRVTVFPDATSVWTWVALKYEKLESVFVSQC